MTAIYDLPLPQPQDLSRSRLLTEYIRHAIDKKHGFISFADYMSLALYHPDYGYYNSDRFTLGKAGDFTTAPEISPLFSAAVANCLSRILKENQHQDILECGAGTGRLAIDVLTQLEKLNALPKNYLIYEPHLKLRKKQEQFIKTNAPAYTERIQWIDKFPNHFRGIIFANEVLDALPIHCFTVEEQEIKERGVTFKNDHFEWACQPPLSTDFLTHTAHLHQQYLLPAGYQSEINLSMPALLKEIAASLSEGYILFADYGYGQREYYHPERNTGTMTCFYRHHRLDDPFFYPGLCDITTHVDFTYLAEMAIENGLLLKGFTTQAGFLLENGLTELITTAEQNLPPAEAFKLHHAIKLLTLPTEMGERIKFMAFSKQADTPLTGFTLQDRRRDL